MQYHSGKRDLSSRWIKVITISKVIRVTCVKVLHDESSKQLAKLLRATDATAATSRQSRI